MAVGDGPSTTPPVLFGRGLRACPATGDGVALAVRWHNDSDLRKPAGRPVRLQFELRDGSLYAFRFA